VPHRQTDNFITKNRSHTGQVILLYLFSHLSKVNTGNNTDGDRFHITPFEQNEKQHSTE